MTKKRVVRMCWLMALAVVLFQLPKLALGDHGQEESPGLLLEGSGPVFSGCSGRL